MVERIHLFYSITFEIIAQYRKLLKFPIASAKSQINSNTEIADVFAQGQTYDKVIIESDTSVPSLLDMRNQYVNITRARDDVKIYTDDKNDLKEFADIKTHARDMFDLSVTLEDAYRAESSLKNSDKHIIENKPDTGRKLDIEINLWKGNRQKDYFREF